MECAFQRNSGLMVSVRKPTMTVKLILIVFLGEYDCMDWTDEYLLDDTAACSFKTSAMECDEHLCGPNMYSCGDGQCVQWRTRMTFQRSQARDDDCFNKRNLNYMCEANPYRHAWTQESGLCWPDAGYNDLRYPSWDLINSSTLTNDEKCQYLFRCVLSGRFERDCPCDGYNCTRMMMSVCPGRDSLVVYPQPGLISGNILFHYNYSRSMVIPKVDVMKLGGNLKCRGYHLTAGWSTELPIEYGLAYPGIYNILCNFKDPHVGYKDFLSPFQHDKFCWNESLTFNGHPYAINPDACPVARECISQYRIRDGLTDCVNEDDENGVLNKSHCTGNVGRHRFQCFNEEHECLSLYWLGSQTTECSNNYDEMWYGVGSLLQTSVVCAANNLKDCGRLKEYIAKSSTKDSRGDSSLVNSQEPTSPLSRIPFRLYCNSFWDLNEHIDELAASCHYWICQSHQYQCQTGQCIEPEWVCDGEWDCSDASDEEALVLIKTWSIHNARLEGLKDRTEKCRKRYARSPFSKICNTSYEFGCYLPRVPNPLDIELNRPCINLTQIGDGVEDCYNFYDEKNTFESNWIRRGMWGFYFRCGNSITQYPSACESAKKNNCTPILCSNQRDTTRSCSSNKGVICLQDNQCKENARCNGIPDCFHGEDEYWCASESYREQITYRINKKDETQLKNLRGHFFSDTRLNLYRGSVIGKHGNRSAP